ncbi:MULTISPECIES: TerC family protein [unclassified Psychrobacter]|uniref:TerC family protein n=1 Tax=unclassified Psychrobacter TaxID=196806 RepID=UPI0015E614CE|nr:MULTISPECIES: TerC family protein [unclassified Psychrobacter]MBA2057668.1 TerC family protein [Psychrobacter sp. D2]
METIGTPWLYAIFFVIVAVMLLIDFLGFKHKDLPENSDVNAVQNEHQPVSIKLAALWSIAWVSVSAIFAGGLWWYLNTNLGTAVANQKTLEFVTGYLIEKSLAIDNVFVWLMIFGAFAVPPALQRRILLYGVIGAIVLRTIFILAGAWLIQEFSWILYIFGAFLVYTGYKFLKGGHDEPVDLEEMKLLKWLRRHMRITPTMRGEKFLVRENGLLWATPMLVVLILVEISDVIFAVDSIPAIFAITTDPFIVLSANLFAILGLRAMFFLLAGAAATMHYLPYGLGVIMTFIGIKMLLLEVYHVPIAASLGFIAIVLVITALMSWRYAKNNPQAQI